MIRRTMKKTVTGLLAVVLVFCLSIMSTVSVKAEGENDKETVVIFYQNWVGTQDLREEELISLGVGDTFKAPSIEGYRVGAMWGREFQVLCKQKKLM